MSRSADSTTPPPTRASRVLVVDDEPAVRTVLQALLEDEGYDASSLPGAEAAVARVLADPPDLVLSDLKMPVYDGLWLVDQLHAHAPDVPVVMLTGYGDTETAVDCLKRGASDYLLKPPRVLDLVRSVERAIGRSRVVREQHRYRDQLEARVREKTALLTEALDAVENAYSATLSALVAALDAREQETSDHSQRVVRFTLAIADRMGISGPLLDDVGRGALLHDIGKIGVPDAVLLKPGPLTPDEWQQMRKHPDTGFQILAGIPFLQPAAAIVLAHQERFDGTGYPRKLRGEEIPIGARIFALADTLDAIVSDRPYRRGQTFEAAVDEIVRCGGTQFDPEAVKAFQQIDVDTLRSLHRGQRRRD